MLDELIFKDKTNDIDFLVSEAITELSLYKQLELLSLAAKKSEKFHSFFHFEQSYFHTQLAMSLKSKGQEIEAQTEFEKALFQDHLNIQAKEFLSLGNSQVKYRRLFNNFIDYVIFATEEGFDAPDSFGYWRFNNNSFEEIISDIKSRHSLYHQEAAKIYYNRSIVFKSLGEEELSKNDIVKAENLDPKILKIK